MCVCVCVCVCVINNSDLCKPPAQVLGLFNFIATLFITLHSFLATKIRKKNKGRKKRGRKMNNVEINSLPPEQQRSAKGTKIIK